MVNPASVPTESSKVRREREEKDAAIETPSRKSRKAGKNGAAGVAGDARVQITAGKGEDRNNGTLGGNAERGPQGVAGSIGGEGNPGSVDPSAAPAATAEGASRPEAPGEVVYRIPSYAGWFRWDKVHPLERRAMSEFFDKRSAAKTPRMYKECRDFTINRCRENLKQAVTFQEVALLAGAVGPRVASAAAQAAVAAIAEDEPGVWEVPFMRRSKVVSGHKKHASQSTQKYGGSVVEGLRDEVQCNGEGPSHGEEATSEKWGAGHPRQPDAAKAGAGGEELPCAVQARVSVATALGVAAANAKLLADRGGAGDRASGGGILEGRESKRGGGVEVGQRVRSGKLALLARVETESKPKAIVLKLCPRRRTPARVFTGPPAAPPRT
nr:uncharacterized protein LOC112281792 [Physcomitrium patens]|eukprot:XP_024374489.1 uncharacterized protein LOC112281792 [Physcomitrella patens]